MVRRSSRHSKLAPAPGWCGSGAFLLRNPVGERPGSTRRDSGFSEQVGWQWTPQPPHERDRSLAPEGLEVGRPQERVGQRAAVLSLAGAYEEEDVTAEIAVPDVALPGRRLLRGAGLGLPVKEHGRDRVVLLARGRRAIALRLLQRHEEQVAVRALVAEDPRLLVRGPPTASRPNAVSTSRRVCRACTESGTRCAQPSSLSSG
jgi:hypothetical protein